LRELEVFDAQKIACAVTEGSRNDLEKLRAAWIWICHNIGNCTCKKCIMDRKKLSIGVF